MKILNLITVDERIVWVELADNASYSIDLISNLGSYVLSLEKVLGITIRSHIPRPGLLTYSVEGHSLCVITVRAQEL